jgi:hypothetical protein
MAERMIHPDLKKAIEKGSPQAYLPPEIVYGSIGEEVDDDFNLLHLGVRVSPKAIRTLLLMTSNGFNDEEGYHRHLSTQFQLNAISYGLFHDFLLPEDIPVLSRGKTPREYFAQSERDIYVGPANHLLGNKVLGSVEEVALDIERRRKYENPNLKVLLLHGKWNTIPHPGHIYAQSDLVQDVSLQHGVRHEDMVTVAVADTNKEVAEAGSDPYLNTLWRVSLLSYSPYCDYVCPSGNFNRKQKEADRHWQHKYALLRPFAIHIARDHPRYDIVLKRCLEVDAIPMSFPRFGDFVPKVGEPFHHIVDNMLSSRRLWKDTVEEGTFQTHWHRLLHIKRIRDELYGRRNWFEPEGVILPNAKIGLTPEHLRPGIIITRDSSAGRKIVIPPLADDPREIQLREALNSLNMGLNS